MQTIRTEQLLGGNKVIVGNKYTDLVLETLGKVYVKTGNKSIVLDNLIQSLINSDKDSEIIFANSTSEMESMNYPGDGRFVYNKLTNTLYISLNNRYIQLIQASVEGSGYVNKAGDTMTGQLEINTNNAPLIVASSQLVKNFNAEYLNGNTSDDFARKKFNEYIYGNWTFRGENVSENNWIFKENTRFYRDIVTSGSLSSPEFSGGFGGYGWRLDSDTNTLTIDNLVVRKVMQVYEMVINQISATNGSLWVSNSAKCTEVFKPIIITKEQLDAINWDKSSPTFNSSELGTLFENGKYYLITNSDVNNLTINRDTNNLGSASETDIGIVTENKSLSSANYINNTSKTFVNYKYLIYMKDIDGLLSDSTLTSPSLLYNEEYINTSNHLTVFYIYKQNYVTQWDENNKPLNTILISTFNKDEGFFSIPRDTSEVVKIKPFYKYFALQTSKMQAAINSEDTVKYVPKMFVFNTDPDENPTLKAGDIIRCQKYEDNNIKYYDGIITAQIKTKTYILQLAPSVFDTYTEIVYNDDGSVKSREERDNTIMYNKTQQSFDVNLGQDSDKYDYESSEDKELSKLSELAPEDDLIQMGNIFNTQRQNAIYITSTDDQGPYIDIMSGLNRPDYSVIYDQPTYKKIKVFVKQKGDIFVQGEAYDYYYQKENPGAINFKQKPSYITGCTKKFPLVYVTINSDLEVTGTYMNDGETNTIPSDTSSGYFITNYPTEYSVRDSGKKGTKITKVRLGNLDGIYNEVFGNKQPYGFGLYGENVFLTGEFYLNNGKSVVDFSKDYIDLAVSNIKVGGRNLVPNSKKEETSTAYGFATASVELKAGKEYVFSANGRCSQQALNEGHWLECFLYNSNWSFSRSFSIKTTYDSTNFIVLTVPSDGIYYIGSYVFPSGGTRNGTATLNWYQVEEGNKPSDWSPNPNDAEQAIESLSARLTVTEGSISAQATKITTIENDLGTVKTTINTAGWITTDQGNTLWATKAENQAAANKAQTALENAATGIANAAAANTLANTANNAAKNAQSTADAAKNQATTNSTLIQQNSNNISILSGRFNADGSLKNTAGLVTGNGNFATLFANAVDADGNIVKQADISAFVTEDELGNAISGLTLTADRIEFKGYTNINNNFIIDLDGNVTVNGDVTATSGTIGGLKIQGNSLVNNGFTSDAYIIFRNDNEDTFVGIGGNVMPVSSGANAVARFQNHASNSFWGAGSNYGIYLSTKNSDNNVSIYNVNGYFQGFRLKIRATSSSETLSSMDNVVIVFGNNTIYLPSDPQEGQVFFIKKANYGDTMYVNGNGHKIANSSSLIEDYVTFASKTAHTGAMYIFSKHFSVTGIGYVWYTLLDCRG